MENLSAFGAAFELLTHGVCVLGPKAELRYANRAYFRITGRQSAKDGLPEPMLHLVLPLIDKAAATGKPAYMSPIEITCPDGGRISVAGWLTPGEPSSGSAVLTFDDVTEIALTEREASMAIRRLESIWELSRHYDEPIERLSTLILDEALRITESAIAFFGTLTDDESALVLIGWSSDVLRGCGVLHPSSLFPVENAGIWADAVREKRSVIVNDYAASPGKNGLPEGHLPLTRMMSVPVVSGGRVTALLCVANKAEDYTDMDSRHAEAFIASIKLIMERRWALDALQRSERYMRQLFEQSTDAIFVHDIESGCVLEANHQACESLGYTKEELLAMRVTDIETGFSANQLKSVYSHVIGGTPVTLEGIHRRKDGSSFPVEVRVGLLSETSPRLAIATVRDLTKRQMTEDALRQALADKDALIREIHHRVKNNLLIIQSLMNLQARQIADPALKHLFSDSIERVKSMGLIHDKQFRSEDFLRIKFGPYLHALATGLMRAHEQSGLRLVTSLPGITLNMDTAIPLALVTNELLTNSVEHAFLGGAPGEISLSLDHNDDGSFTLTVKDTGQGFPEGFDASKAQTLGMQVVSSLVAQIRGRIEFLNTGGAEVRITFSERPG